MKANIFPIRADDELLGLIDKASKITRLSGANLENVQDAVVNLPRSIRDHLTEQPTFGPDGALYVPQGSDTSFGAPDVIWGMRRQNTVFAVGRSIIDRSSTFNIGRLMLAYGGGGHGAAVG